MAFVITDSPSPRGESSRAFGSDAAGRIIGWAEADAERPRAFFRTPATPAPSRRTPVSPQGTKDPSPDRQCDGAAAWLADTAARVDPLFLPLFPDVSDVSLTAYREALTTTQRDLMRGQHPPAAAALNDQILHILGLFLAAANQADGISAMVAVADDPGFQDARRRMLSLSRHLKRSCDLVDNAQFFDPGCYGLEAEQWYARTYQRSLDLLQAATRLDQEAATDQASDETTEERIERLTREFEPILRAQAEEATPPAMETLQQHYLSLFALMTTMWSTILAGDQTVEQARNASTTIGTFLQREQARLDIACPNP